MTFRRMASIKTVAELREHADSLGIDLPVDDAVEAGPDSPLARSYSRSSGTVGNRFAILPMEGWDGTEDGRPSDLTRAPLAELRPERGQADLGGRGRRRPARRPGQPESVDDQRRQSRRDRRPSSDLDRRPPGRLRDGRRPPDRPPVDPLGPIRQALREGAARAEDRLPASRARPGGSGSKTTPLCSPTTRSPGSSTTSSGPPGWPQDAGFAFVDIKHCHGYLGHEFLSAL